MRSPSVLIVGGGIAGPALASFLLLSPTPACEKPRITLLERSTAAMSQGQNIDVRGAGVTVVRKLGLESAVRAHTTKEAGVHFVDEHNVVFAESPADRTGEVQTGTSDVEIMRGRLAQLCNERSVALSRQVQAAGGAGIEYIIGDSLQSLEQDDSAQKVHVQFSKSGERRTYDVVVGADGMMSPTRRLAFGDGEEDAARVEPTGMYGAFFSMPKSDTDSEWRRWFNAPGRRGIMQRPSEDPTRSTIFMYIISDDPKFAHAAELTHRGISEQKALFDECFRDVGWESARIIREMHAADDFYYNMVAQVKMPSWSTGNVALVGDAGYCPSPISGMGTTLALVGAYNLAGALTKHPTEATAAFAAYETSMRPTVEKAQKLYPGAPTLNNPQSAWGVSVLRKTLATLFYSPLQELLFRFAGPPANAVPVEEYGFIEVPDTREPGEIDTRGLFDGNLSK